MKKGTSYLLLKKDELGVEHGRCDRERSLIGVEVIGGARPSVNSTSFYIMSPPRACEEEDVNN